MHVPKRVTFALVEERSDVPEKPLGTYRIVAWSVSAGLQRRYDRLVALDADVAVVPRAVHEPRLLRAEKSVHSSMAWIGRHTLGGLGVLGFGGSRVRLDGGRWDQRLEWIAPVNVDGPVGHHILAVWALHEKAQVSFRSKPPASQPVQMMRLYERLLTKPCLIAGDFDNNPVFHRNDPNWDMLGLVSLLDAAGYVSAYHVAANIEHGDPREPPTRLRKGDDGVISAHHVDYCFIPRTWVPALRNVQIGDRAMWISNLEGEDHVPLVCDFDQTMLRSIVDDARKRARS